MFFNAVQFELDAGFNEQAFGLMQALIELNLDGCISTPQALELLM